MAFLLDGMQLSLGSPFTYNDIQYPSNWLRLASQEERDALGIIEIPDPEPFDPRFWWGRDENGDLISKDHADLVSEWTSLAKQTAGTLLAQSDWLVIREQDQGVPMPIEWRAWRQAVRDASAAKAEALAATADTAALAAYATDPEGFAVWPEQPTGETSPTVEVNYRAFYDTLLASPAYQVIRQKAVTSAPVLAACVEFIAAIGDAKMGRPNKPAIQACVDLLCAAAQFTPEELQGLGMVMAAGGLDQVYALPVPE